ncbi:sulfate transporter CysZ [Leucothrix pacifica]|uniref:Sulfate transporter CysZ n=1 Tax=Leucothrix pacifica TaxID=1247513 RepID=A0A317CKC0_9GAMM|nr:sulfate transporter CysZ [Leucothrix pacifica]PWQ99045.1 sulfate transporter CysZ [Leucothrix pacifica]
MIQGFMQGIAYFFQGFTLITQKGIRGFVLIPLLINIVVFSAAVWLAYGQFQSLMDSLTAWLPSWLSWIEWVLLPFFAILVLLIIYYTFSIIANFIASPFNSLLAERVEKKLNGLPLPESSGFKAMAVNVGKALGSEVKKMIYMLKWMPVLLLITVIPGLNLIAPAAWIIYGAWMYSLQYADYPMGNHEMFIKEELVVLRKNRSHALGFGAATTLMTIIPVVNFFAMPVAVAGATAMWVKQLSR